MADLIPLSDVTAVPDASGSVPAQQAAPGLIGLDEITAAPKAAETTPQMTGLARAAALPASGFAQGIMQTLAPFAAEGANPGGAFTGLSQTPQTELAPQLPAAAMDLGKQAGLYDRPDLTPQNPIEQGVVSAARGAGRALPAVALGGAGAIPLGLATGATGGVAGDVAETALPDHPVLAQVAGNVLGSAGGAGIISGISHLAAPFLEAGTRAVSSGAEATQAAGRLAKAMQSDINSGAVTPSDFQNAAANGLKPWELENAENTRALAGTVTRSGGPARTTMRAYAKDEDAAAPARLDDALSGSLGSGDINSVVSKIATDQKTNAAPLYEKAFQGGSSAPLQTQFESAFSDISGQESDAQKALRDANNAMTQAQAQASRVGNDVYGTSSANQAIADAQQKMTAAEQALGSIQGQKQSILERLQQAQQDGSANAPGAVWSPRIQQFLSDPVMKAGLNKGLQIQRIESVAQGKPFNASEYAITGADEQGNPVVGTVPNMRLLDAGKKGLDAIIGENQDSITGRLNEYGRAVNQFKQAYLKELDGVNPDYAAARAAWSGPAQSLNAIRDGARAMSKPPAEITSDLADLSPSDQQLYRLSALQSSVSPKMNGGSLGSNEAARLLSNAPDQLKPQLSALLPDDASRQSVLSAAQNANLKFQAKQAISGGSQTVERAVDQGAHAGPGGTIGNAIAAGVAMHTGEPFVSMTYLQRLAKDIVGHKMSASPSLNHSMAKMLVGSQDDLQPALAQLQPQGYSAPRIYPQLLAVQSIAAANQPAPNRQALIEQLMAR